jgi:hypothetical protein
MRRCTRSGAWGRWWGWLGMVGCPRGSAKARRATDATAEAGEDATCRLLRLSPLDLLHSRGGGLKTARLDLLGSLQ